MKVFHSNYNLVLPVINSNLFFQLLLLYKVKASNAMWRSGASSNKKVTLGRERSVPMSLNSASVCTKNNNIYNSYSFI